MCCIICYKYIYCTVNTASYHKVDKKGMKNDSVSFSSDKKATTEHFRVKVLFNRLFAMQSIALPLHFFE